MNRIIESKASKTNSEDMQNDAISLCTKISLKTLCEKDKFSKAQDLKPNHCPYELNTR
jgi:hypothetical protein